MKASDLRSATKPVCVAAVAALREAGVCVCSAQLEPPPSPTLGKAVGPELKSWQRHWEVGVWTVEGQLGLQCRPLRAAVGGGARVKSPNSEWPSGSPQRRAPHFPRPPPEQNQEYDCSPGVSSYCLSSSPRPSSGSCGLRCRLPPTRDKRVYCCEAGGGRKLPAIDR